MLTVKHISKQFHKQTIINDVSFTLEKGQCTALIGPNGSGKTTILRMLTGLIKPNDGTITYNYPNDFRQIIGYLPQYPTFHDWMSGREFLTFSAKLYGLSTNETNERIDELLKKVDLNDAQQKRIGTYSGGMKQRLGIAQALIHHPKILFLDEPVSSLDPIGRRDVLTLMQQLKNEMTILFSTHILNDADEISDSLIVLKDGEVVEKGSILKLQEKYTTSKIIVQFHSVNDTMLTKLNELPTVTTTETIGNHLHLYVTDVAAAQTELLTFIDEQNLALSEYRVGRLTIEEMFVKAVN